MSDQLVSEKKKDWIAVASAEFLSFRWLQQQHRRVSVPHTGKPQEHGAAAHFPGRNRDGGSRQPQEMPLTPPGTSRGTQLLLHCVRPCPGLSPSAGNHRDQLFFQQLILDPKIKSAIPRITTFPGESQSPKDQYFQICRSRGCTVLLRPVTWIIKA